MNEERKEENRKKKRRLKENSFQLGRFCADNQKGPKRRIPLFIEKLQTTINLRGGKGSHSDDCNADNHDHNEVSKNQRKEAQF
jgi:hypothetical protein